ncbi:30S ribosomal protein S12 methylthiotransferase RimO [bacterium]|nr:30S ribosomal protein S12 methylthiotransferase RimO [bacterium]
MKKVSVVTMGCSKNLVDSEVILGIVKGEKYEITENAYDSDIIIVNTCGFIEAAKEESIDAILEATALKNKGKVEKVIVAGCLSGRYKAELQKEIPEVDIFLGPQDYKGIQDYLDLPERPFYKRILTTPSHFAYLKISEGCSNPCTFCAIPKMRGNHISKPMEEVIVEAEFLASQGVKEIILIAQDSTMYGLDLYGKMILPDLIKNLDKVHGIEWFRTMYTYPAFYTDEVTLAIAESEKFTKYIDFPLQHVNDRILKLMQRNITKDEIHKKITKMRSVMPELTLRTTVITGFPTETEDEFLEMLDFIEEQKFERLGAFAYSIEDKTKAGKMKEQISDELKEERRSRVMELQTEISFAKNVAMIGKEFKVLIDSFDAQSQNYVGRTFRDAPEIDNEVFFTGKNLKVGEFYEVKINDATEFDLYGEVVQAKIFT